VDDVIDKFIKQELEQGEDLCDHPHSETRPSQQNTTQKKGKINTQKKICFTAKGSTIEDDIDPRFGRAAFFLIYDPQTKTIESTENPNKDLMQGVGIKSAQFLADNNVGTLITGRTGPKAEAVLQSSNIHAITGMSGPVKDTLKKYSLEVK
jgi:predicted Fe-Mo cluster-binding NifX family protein